MSGTSRVFINSDFKDYYDSVASNTLTEKSVVYNRILKNVPGKVTELRNINNLGLKTIKLQPVSKFDPRTSKVVVYADTQGHRGEGKMVMSLSEANLMYRNKLASEYFECNKELTFKILTVGKRRFKIILRNRNQLIENEVLELQELASGYNYNIACPIFSLDYVKNNEGEMLVCDFNIIQRLDYLGIQNIMSEEEVIKEIYGALVAYNKI